MMEESIEPGARAQPMPQDWPGKRKERYDEGAPELFIRARTGWVPVDWPNYSTTENSLISSCGATLRSATNKPCSASPGPSSIPCGATAVGVLARPILKSSDLDEPPQQDHCLESQDTLVLGRMYRTEMATGSPENP